MGTDVNMQRRCALIKANATTFAAVAMLAMGSTALHADDFPLVGSYMENEPCKPDSPSASRVTITATEINSPMGLCKILDVKHNGNTFAVHVECSGPAGNQMLGNVNFTIREDQTIDFSDQDDTYKSVLYRCP
jgi:hypothetical protein